MKVLGTTKNSSTYICEVSHSELEKFMDQYYGSKKLKEMKTGDEINLGEGYDFYKSTISALQETKDFIAANSKTIDAIMNGFRILGNTNEIKENM